MSFSIGKEPTNLLVAIFYVIMTDNQKRGAWSQDEDLILLRLLKQHGPSNWVKISSFLKTRSPKQCRERYHQNLKPTLNKSPITHEEGEIIRELVSKKGKKWAEISRILNNGRSDNAIKNWWNGVVNKRTRVSKSFTTRPVVRNVLLPRVVVPDVPTPSVIIKPQILPPLHAFKSGVNPAEKMLVGPPKVPCNKAQFTLYSAKELPQLEKFKAEPRLPTLLSKNVQLKLINTSLSSFAHKDDILDRKALGKLDFLLNKDRNARWGTPFLDFGTSKSVAKTV